MSRQRVQARASTCMGLDQRDYTLLQNTYRTQLSAPACTVCIDAHFMCIYLICIRST